MCEVCEIRERCDKLSEEMSFRIVQYQAEINFGRLEEAQVAQARAHELLEFVFTELAMIPEAMARVESGIVRSGLH